MAARALPIPPRTPANESVARRHIRAVPRAVALPLASTRRPVLNAAAQEKLVDDLRFAAFVAGFACCAGAGLALGLHWDDALASLRLAVFSAEEPRWLLQIVDQL